MSAPRLRTLAQYLFWAWFIGLNVLFTGIAIKKTFFMQVPKSDPYQAWWVGLVGPLVFGLSALAVRYPPRFSLRIPPSILFLGAALVGVVAEEFTCYSLGTGRFRSPGDPVRLFLEASLALYLACIGAWVAFRWLALRWWDRC